MKEVTADILKLEEFSNSIETYVRYVKTLVTDKDIEECMYAANATDYFLYKDRAADKVDIMKEFVKLLGEASTSLGSYIHELDKECKNDKKRSRGTY